ncbi:hypothetical protein JIQ42_07068 [Leishmania sp. Namibia]|uniref:hypothetical protein n=1 Tax=Leishmania sp. Namibia TaxID=2802991 RepID=UPI001B7604CA|nr:hypothetical protein JIQ42_07068 [Leishmania sp. Namibia]
MAFRPHDGRRLCQEAAALGLPELLVPPFKWPLLVTALDVLEATTSASAQSPVDDVDSVVDTHDDIGGEVMEPEGGAASWEALRHHQGAVCCLVQQLAGPQFRVLPWDLDALNQRSVASTTPSRSPPLSLPALPPRRVFLAESTDFAGHGCVVKLLPAPAPQGNSGSANALSSATNSSPLDSSAYTPRWSPHCPVKEPAVSAEAATLLHLRAPLPPRFDHEEVLLQRVFEAHPNVVTALGVVMAEERVCCCQYASVSQTPMVPAAMGDRSALAKGGRPTVAAPCEVRAMLLENVSGGAWCDFLDTYGEFVSPLCVMRWFMDVTTGLAHLHSHRVVHGNLTPANILVRLTAVGPRGAFGGANAPAQEYDCVGPLLEALAPRAGIVDLTSTNGRAMPCEQLILSALLEKTQLVLSGFRCARRMLSDDGDFARKHVTEVEEDPLRGPRQDRQDARAAAADLWNAALAFYLLLIGDAAAVARGWDAPVTRGSGCDVAGTPAYLHGGIARPLLRLVSMRPPKALSPGPMEKAGGRSESDCEPELRCVAPESVIRPASHTGAADAAPPLQAAQMAARLHPRWATLPCQFLEILDEILQSDGDPTKMPTAAETMRLMAQIMASPPVLQRCMVCVVPPPALLLEQLLDSLRDSADGPFVCRPMACMPLGCALQDADARMLCLRIGCDASDASLQWLQLVSWGVRLLELERILVQPAGVLAEWAAVDDSALVLQRALTWISQQQSGTRQPVMRRADFVALLLTIVRRAMAEAPSVHDEQRGRRQGTPPVFSNEFQLIVACCIAWGQPPPPLKDLIICAVMVACIHFQRAPIGRGAVHSHGFMRS